MYAVIKTIKQTEDYWLTCKINFVINFHTCHFCYGYYTVFIFHVFESSTRN